MVLQVFPLLFTQQRRNIMKHKAEIFILLFFFIVSERKILFRSLAVRSVFIYLFIYLFILSCFFSASLSNIGRKFIEYLLAGTHGNAYAKEKKRFQNRF